MLTVTTPASDPTLLTLAEITAAVGGKASDAENLTQLNRRISELLAGACGLPRAGAAVLTLRQEVLSETLRIGCGVATVDLSRRPVTAVLEVTESDVALYEEDDFEFATDHSLRRLCNGEPTVWTAGKVVISYRAGWEAVPHALKELASKLAVSIWAERGRDPSLQRVRIEGVSERQYWVGAKDDPLITAEIIEGLRSGGFMLQKMVY